jgi:hypothetical protein
MKFKSNVELEALSNATTDTDRFIVSDSNTLKYRTGSQVLSDIGGQASLTNPVTGTGTLNFVSKFTSTGSTLGNSLIYDNGTYVGIGTTSPGYKLDIAAVINNQKLFRLSHPSAPTEAGFMIGFNSDGITNDVIVSQSVEYSSVDYDVININRSNRNVGIGTTSPADKLEVLGNIRLRQSLSNAETVYISTNSRGGGTNDADLRLGNSNNGDILTINNANVGIGTVSPGAKLVVSDDSTTIASSITNSNSGGSGLQITAASGTNNILQLRNYLGGEVMRVRGDGNVGIGTTIPGFKLDVSGNGIRNIRTTAGWAGWFENTGSSSGVIVTAGVDSGDAPLLIRKQDGTELFSVRGNGTSWFNGGNVGIGTTSPGYKLDVAGEVRANNLFRTTDGTNIGLFGSSVFASNVIGVGSSNAVPLVLGTSATERMRILANGNVGIGTTNPGAALHVQSSTTKLFLSNTDFNTSTTTGSGLILHTGASSGNTYGQIYAFQSGNTSYANLVVPGGNVGIGTTSPGAKLDVNGDVFINSNYTGSNVAANDLTIGKTTTGNHGITIATGPTYTGSIYFGDSDNNDAGIIGYQHSDNSMKFTTNRSEKMRITSSGIFMVGGTTGGYAGTKIHVGNFTDSQNGINILTSTTGYGHILFGDGTGADTYRGQITYYHGDDSMSFNASGSEKLRIVSGGGISFAGATNFGSAGQILKSNGSASPAWVDASTVIGGPYLPLSAGASYPLTGDVVISSTMPKLTFTDLQQDDWRIMNDNGDFRFTNIDGSGHALVFAANNNATFAGDVNVTGVIDTAQYINVGTQNSTFSENNLRFRSAGPAYLDHNTVSQTIKFRLSSASSLDVIPFEITPFYMASSVDMYFGDNDKLRLGASSDLQIYHDGSNSFIEDVGTGSLIIKSSPIIEMKGANNEFIARFIENGSVDLYYNNNLKFETTGTGVTVTGDVTASGTVNADTYFQSTDASAVLATNGAGSVFLRPNGPGSGTGALSVASSGNVVALGTVTAPTFLGDLDGTINTATTAVTKANATNDTTVATTAFVQNLIGTIPAGLVFQGTWNAATNTPTLTSGTGTTGHFYIVSTSGSTNLDGVTDWVTGDWAVFIEQGATDAWEKVDNSSVLDGAGTGQTVALWSGSGTSNTLDDSILTQSGGSIITQTATSVAQYSLDSIAANDSVVNFKQAGVQKAKIGYDHSEDALAFIHGSGAFSTAGMVLDGTGVGIGTTSPGANLEVAKGSEGLYLKVGGDNASNGRGLTFSSSSNNGSVGALHTINATSVSGAISLNTAGVSRLFLDRLGNVGIGTASPQTELHIKGNNGWGEIRIEGQTFASGHGASLEFYSGGTALADIYANTSKDLILRTNGTTERMRITSAGNVGIGTTGPTYKLAVSGGIEAGGKVTYSKSAGSLDTTGYAVAGLLAASNGNSCMFIFTAIGHTGHYQKVVYSCWNAAGIWNTSKVIDEGTNGLDVEASANAATITFTFKSRSGSLNYTPRVTVEASGAAINNTYA